jgi:signal peptidase I
MSLLGTTQDQQLHAKPRLNWKRGAIALVLAILVVGLGHLYDRRWRLAVAYELLVSLIYVIARQAVLRSVLAGIVILICSVLLRLFIIGQAVWFGLRRPKGAAMPRLSKLAWTTAGVAAIISAAGLSTGFFQTHVVGLKGYVINSDSMTPTLRSGDRVFVDLRAYRHSQPERGDVVSFIGPSKATYAKRVMGVPGDTLNFTEAGIECDGHVLKEPYLAPRDPDAHLQRVFPEHLVSPRDVFVLGDNRDNSYDSRYFGDVPDKAVMGKVLGIYWSRDLSRIGTAVH